jgi:hypothetical protein
VDLLHSGVEHVVQAGPEHAARPARDLVIVAGRVDQPRGLLRPPGRRRAGEMPPGCDCARVVLGRLYPNQCRLFGAACTPRTPIGPCMVSDEGACRIWWSSGVREAVAPHPVP